MAKINHYYTFTRQDKTVYNLPVDQAEYIEQEALKEMGISSTLSMINM